MSTTRQPNGEFEPNIGAEQLDEFFRELRRTVIDLEQAYQQGKLLTHLDQAGVEARFGTALQRCYRRLAREDRERGQRLHDPQGRRMQTVHELLREVREELFQIDTWFHASVVPLPTEIVSEDQHQHQNQEQEQEQDQELHHHVSEHTIPPIDLRHQFCVHQDVDRPIYLRLDQILASRSWGIGFVFDDQRATDRLVALMTGKALRKFARDLEDLATLLSRILRRRSDRFPNLVPPRFGRAFEQLMTDILNEDGPHAQLSSLCEDYSQKTDIRVKYPDLDRNRGARVQVTTASTEDHYVQKIEGIRHADQFVILCPWSLAAAVPQLGDHDSNLYSSELMSAFWGCIPGMPSSIEDLSKQLKIMLCGAITEPIRDPHGPMIHVPEPVRRFIRIYVHAEAIRSTQILREREAIEGRYRTGRDGRLVAQRHVDAELSPEVIEFMHAHTADATVRAVVTRLERDCAWARLSTDLVGRIDRKEISWSDPKADPGRFLQIDQEYEFKFRRVDASRSPGVIDLSLKRMIPDPWCHENLRTLADQGIIDGTVVRCAPYGLFVEVMQDMIGLLHQSQLPSGHAEPAAERFPIGTSIRVSIESIDIQTRRMALTPV